MRLQSFAVMALVGLLHQPAIAATRNQTERPAHGAQKWSKEPDGFMGIKFGEQLPKSIPPCLSEYVDHGVGQLKSMCFDGDRLRYGKLYGGPDLGFPYTVSVMLAQGIPITFVLQTEPQYFSRLADVLKRRYGAPQYHDASTVKSQAGAEFDNETLRWLGSHVVIDSNMRKNQIDTSMTYISDKAYWEGRSAGDATKRAKAAAEL